MRDHVVFACGFTQVEIDQSPVSVEVMLLGMVTHSPLPDSASAPLPILPVARGPPAWPPGVVTGPVAHRLLRIEDLTLSAIPFSSSALAWLPRMLYSCAAALASEYWNELSVRSCARVPYCWKATESASLPGSVPALYSMR